MIILVLLLGLLVRLINLNQSLWLDEAITATAIKNNSFTQLITFFSRGDFHPPLYYLFLKFWSEFFGYNEIALRFPSIIFGLITVYLVFLIGKKNGLLAALFLAVNPLAVYYSQEARMYSLAMMLVAASILFLQGKKWFWFIVAATLSLYTDYLPILMFPVYFLISQKKKIVFFPLILFIPWLPYFWQQLQVGLSLSSQIPGWSALLGQASVKALILFAVKFIFGRVSWDNGFVYSLIAGPVLLIYSLLLMRSRQKAFWLWLILPVVLGFILSFKVSVLAYFRFLFILPAFVLLLAGKSGKLATVFVVLVSLISLVYFNTDARFWRENWRGAVTYMDTTDSIVVMPSLAQSDPLAYYKPALRIMDQSNLDLNGVQTVYLLRYVQEIFDPQDLERQKLEIEGYKRTEEKSFSNLLIWKYSL